MKQSFLFLMILLLTACFPLASQSMMMPTEEELIKMNQEIETFRASMTEEQRNDFDRQVQELSKVMENMSEEELNKFIETVFSQDTVEPIMPPSAPVVAPPVAITPEVKPVEPLYKESTVSKKDKETSKNMLSMLINHIESFLRKATLISDLYGPLNTWVPAAIIAGKTELTWQELKQETERLISSLKLLLTSDPKIGHYYYLASFIENDALYQTIIRLNDALVRNEPNITVTAFGVSNLSKESRKATEIILSALVQALYTHQIIQEMEKLFSGFAPEAKKVLEQEETARKKALEESKRTASQVPMRLGGTLYEDFASPGYTLDTNEPYAASSFTAPASYKSELPTPTYEHPETLTSKKTPTTTPNTREKTEKEEPTKKQKAEAVPVKTDAAEKIIEKIESFIEDCIIAIKAKKLHTTVMAQDKQEVVSEIASKIARITSRIKTLENVMKDYPSTQKNMFMDRIKIMIKDEKDLFDTIISTIEANQETAPAAALELHTEIISLFKKLDIIHTKKAIKSHTAQEQPTKKPTTENTAKMAKEIEKFQAGLTPELLTKPSSAEIHPAALPGGQLQGVSDIHPAAMIPVSLETEEQ